MASYHLDGDAQIWLQRMKSRKKDLDWPKLKDELYERFGSSVYEDAFEELCKLKQSSTGQEYRTHFERLLGHAGDLTDKQEVGMFVSGLHESIKAHVKAQHPQNLSSAIGLARVFENNEPNPKGEPRPSFSARRFGPGGNLSGEARKPSPPVMANRRPTPVPPNIRKFSSAELRDRRSKGLCYHCDEKYIPSHQCKRLF